MNLEDQYSRLVRLFPSDWRRRNEEDLVGTLLDAAKPGQERISSGEVLDLVRSAAVLHFRCLARHRLVVPVRSGLAVVWASIALFAGLALALNWSGFPAISPEFLVTSLVVVVVPGTGVVYTVSTAVAGGRHRGLVAAVGCTLGIVPHLLAAMLGLSGIMQAGAVAYEVVRWAGVVYLVYLGVSMIFESGALRLDAPRGESHSPALTVRRAILLNLLNPKLTLFFFAFLPQFLDTPPTLFDSRLVGLSAVFMLMTLAVFAGYAYASAAVRDKVLATPRILRWVQRSLGAVLIGFAAKLAFDER